MSDEGDGLPQHVLCQRLGVTEKAYQARLTVAKQQFAKHVRAQRLGPQCEEIRARLGNPLGAHTARVEAHLEDCYPCRAWQLFHRDHAAATLIPSPLLGQWDALSARAHSLLARATPAALPGRPLAAVPPLDAGERRLLEDGLRHLGGEHVDLRQLLHRGQQPEEVGVRDAGPVNANGACPRRHRRPRR